MTMADMRIDTLARVMAADVDNPIEQLDASSSFHESDTSDDEAVAAELMQPTEAVADDPASPEPPTASTVDSMSEHHRLLTHIAAAIPVGDASATPSPLSWVVPLISASYGVKTATDPRDADDISWETSELDATKSSFDEMMKSITHDNATITNEQLDKLLGCKKTIGPQKRNMHGLVAYDNITVKKKQVILAQRAALLQKLLVQLAEGDLIVSSLH